MKYSVLVHSFVKFLLLIVAITYTAWVLSDMVWYFFTPKKISQSSQSIVIGEQDIKLPQNIFGIEKKIVKKIPTKVKTSRINLILAGIINKKDNPLAIMRFDKNAIDNVYKIGDKINNDTSVKDIQNTFVIIDHNGVEQKIELKYKTDKNFEYKNTTQDNSVKKLINPKTKKAQLPYNDKRKLRSYLAGVRTNPASALAIVKIEPNFISGLLEGVKIYPSKEVKLFNKIGFKPGDIVVQINDIKLNSIQQAFRISRELSTQKVFDFVVMRNGVQEHISLDIN